MSFGLSVIAFIAGTLVVALCIAAIPGPGGAAASPGDAGHGHGHGGH